jgi:hypothetical protein
LLEAHRYLAHGDIPQAIAIGAPIAITLKAAQFSTAVKSILVALQDAARSMSGMESLTLATLLQQNDSDNVNLEVIGTVQSVSELDGAVEILWRGKVFKAIKRQLKSPVSVGDVVEFVPRRGNRVGALIAQEVCKLNTENDNHEIR